MKKNKRPLNMMLLTYMLCVMVITAVFIGLSYYLLMYGQVVPYAFAARATSPFLVMAITIMLSTTFSTLVSVRILKPVNSLIKATKRVAKGDFSVRVADQGVNSEMAELVHSFNGMVSELSGIEMFRKDFINNFSHEFKTPIVSIRGFAKQLQRDDITPEQRREYAEIIAGESERLANMASNILLLTKLENQRIVTDVTTYRLDEQIRSAILLLEKQWTQKDIELQLTLDEMEFVGNEEMVQHVWINLIGNAVKFSKPGGRVMVGCRREGDWAVVDISDEGVGMDEATCRHIFEKFYQGDSAHATEGNGLGLSLVKRIVDLCGGSVEARSTPGKGAFFTVRLPILPENAAQDTVSF